MKRWWRQFKKQDKLKPNILSCIIILKKKWSVISKLFPLNWIFHYISNFSKVSEFYLTSFFNIKSWREKIRNFLGGFPFHYVPLFINRTINNNYDFINGLPSFHDMMDFDTFLDAARATLFPGTLPTLNLPIKNHLSSG